MKLRRMKYLEIQQRKFYKGIIYHNRFRYYDSKSVTYISKDPIGHAGNNSNAYTHDFNRMVDALGLDPFFRGTPIGFNGSNATQRIGITPVMTEPRVATIFANHSSNYGEAVVQIFDKGAIDSSKILDGNVLASFENKVGIDMLPNDLR